MRFGIVPFAAVFGCAGRIEVAQGSVADCVSLFVPLERVFKGEFGFAVRVGWVCGVALFDWLLRRFAVNGSGRREDEARDTTIAHRVEQNESCGDVVAVILRRLLDSLADEAIGRHLY